MVSSILVGATSIDNIFYSDLPHEDPAKTGGRDQRGPGGVFTRPQAGAYGANRRNAAALRRSGVLFNRLKSTSPGGRNLQTEYRVDAS